MIALIHEFETISSIKQDIEQHPAWIGLVSGLKAEKLLRGLKKPYLYVLRKGETEGEHETDYYVTFVLPDYSIKHQPFVITTTEKGWCFENMAPGGPFTEAVVDDVIHLIMHCRKNECEPYVDFFAKGQ